MSAEIDKDTITLKLQLNMDTDKRIKYLEDEVASLSKDVSELYATLEKVYELIDELIPQEDWLPFDIPAFMWYSNLDGY